MDDKTVPSYLEELAQKLGVPIRYECMEDDTAFSSGGFCRIRNKSLIIINEKASKREKVQTLARALRRFDLSQIYLMPALRDLLDDPIENEEPGEGGCPRMAS